MLSWGLRVQSPPTLLHVPRVLGALPTPGSQVGSSQPKWAANALRGLAETAPQARVHSPPSADNPRLMPQAGGTPGPDRQGALRDGRERPAQGEAQAVRAGAAAVEAEGQQQEPQPQPHEPVTFSTVPSLPTSSSPPWCPCENPLQHREGELCARQEAAETPVSAFYLPSSLPGGQGLQAGKLLPICVR